MIDDPEHGYVLGLGNKTWAWDGSTWTNVSAGSVSGRLGLAYDALRSRPVAMGFGGTAAWDGANWVTVLPFPSPPAGSGGQNFAYDDLRDRGVYLGGGTWEWDGQLWSRKLPPLEPPPRNGKAMTYSRSSGCVVLFGGFATYPIPLGDTWLWDGKDWVQSFPLASPPSRFDHALAYDTKRSRVVLFGGRDARRS